MVATRPEIPVATGALTKIGPILPSEGGSVPAVPATTVGGARRTHVAAAIEGAPATRVGPTPRAAAQIAAVAGSSASVARVASLAPVRVPSVGATDPSSA